jgi:nucleotide-binding universal stress UspA family protein
MSKPLLVGYDPRTEDRAPVAFGVAAARFTGAPLIVGCACAGGRRDEDLPDDAKDALDRVREALASEGLSILVRELPSTSAARALHEAAVSDDAGLVIVGSTRRGTVGRVLPGSTAERLMHGAPCPVAVVPLGWETRGGLRTIAVAYVDTEEGGEALRGAHALARRAGAKLRVITVAQRNMGMLDETEPRVGVQPGKETSEIEGEHRVAAESEARAAVQALGDGVEVEVDGFTGDPADALIRVSENVDLLICGSRGYGPIRAVLLGGVSRRVAAEAHCPVIVLPRGVSSSLESIMREADPALPA